jgi:hypothetical protein
MQRERSVSSVIRHVTMSPDLVPVALERTLVATSGQITDLRFAVQRSG